MDTHALLIWRELLEGSVAPSVLYAGYIVVPLGDDPNEFEHLDAWVEVARGTEEEMETLHILTKGVNDDIA
jgi:hypothetical protein